MELNLTKIDKFLEMPTVLILFEIVCFCAAWLFVVMTNACLML